MAELGGGAAAGETPPEKDAPRQGGNILWPINRGLKRKRVTEKGLPEAWTPPPDIAGHKVQAQVEAFRQEWRKQQYHAIKLKFPDLKAPEVWTLAGQMWTQLPIGAKQFMAAHTILSTTNGDIPKLYEIQEARTVMDLEKKPWKAPKLGGALYTWNGDWCLEDPEACLAAQQCPDHDTWTLRAKELNCYRKEIHYFGKWFEARCKHLHITDWSWCCELSLKSMDAPTRMHFHAFVSFSDKPVYLGENFLWKPPGGHAPKIEIAFRNRQLLKAIGRGHYYCQAPKVGQLVMNSTFPHTDCFSIEQRWIMELWKQKKLKHYHARQLVIVARGNTDRCLREIDLVERSEREAQEAHERAQQMARWVRGQKPFKVVPEVMEWKCMMELTQNGKRDSSARSKFLVLEGDSQKGKTMFAQGLWGIERTLVVNCQGVAEPNLRSFNRAIHKCIVFDEIEASTVINNKQLFQGSVNATLLGQSVCAQHAYQCYLYGIGLIMSCNKWLETGKKKTKISQEERQWLVANSVHVVVNEKLYMD